MKAKHVIMVGLMLGAVGTLYRLPAMTESKAATEVTDTTSGVSGPVWASSPRAPDRSREVPASSALSAGEQVIEVPKGKKPGPAKVIPDYPHIAGTNYRTSFDCANATTWAEKAVCTDPQLADHDVALSKLFADARDRVPDRTVLRAHAREALAYRDGYCHDRQCLLDWYSVQEHWYTDVIARTHTMAATANPS